MSEYDAVGLIGFAVGALAGWLCRCQWIAGKEMLANAREVQRQRLIVEELERRADELDAERQSREKTLEFELDKASQERLRKVWRQ